MAMDYAFYMVGHIVAHNMVHNMVAVLGRGNSFVLHYKASIVMAVQPVQLVAQVVSEWLVVASLLPEVALLFFFVYLSFSLNVWCELHRVTYQSIKSAKAKGGRCRCLFTQMQKLCKPILAAKRA